MLLRHLIEKAGNRSFSEMITAEICSPLGLEHTAVIESQADLCRLIPGYSRALAETGSPEVDVRTRYDPAWIATGVVASTAAEIVRFYRGLFAGALLPPALLHEMRRVRRAVVTHPRYVTPGYGLGLMADPDGPYGAMHGHNGAGPGYSASAFHFKPSPDDTFKGVTIAVLCNMENTDETESMMLALADTLTEGRRSSDRS
jgi:D-alanyl-D-alanine carboxypeptidase